MLAKQVFHARQGISQIRGSGFISLRDTLNGVSR